MWPVINQSALIGRNILFSLNPVITTNERIQFITGHMVYNLPYDLILQLKAIPQISLVDITANHYIKELLLELPLEILRNVST